MTTRATSQSVRAARVRPASARGGLTFFGMRAAALLSLAAVGCLTSTLPPLQSECGEDDPRIGQTADLVPPPHCALPIFDHDISGTAMVVDNCTIAIEGFTYDGNALDARVAGVINEDWLHPIMLTENLSRSTPYRNETLTITLPEGVTLDDVQHIAVVCAPFRINFGDGWFH